VVVVVVVWGDSVLIVWRVPVHDEPSIERRRYLSRKVRCAYNRIQS
jgi:hypothetical protein